jgi:hypothetical protein
MADGAGSTLEIKSEAHGPHWVAWIAGADGKPQDSVLLVGQTREEAESRARSWAESRRERA